MSVNIPTTLGKVAGKCKLLISTDTLTAFDMVLQDRGEFRETIIHW